MRLANKADVTALVRLNRFVQDLHASLYPAQFKSDALEAEVTKFFSDLVESDPHSFGIFKSSKGPAGYIWIEEIARSQSPFMRPVRRLHIHHISVDPDWRGKGVGSALVDWANDRARAAGIQEVTADHWAANSDAHGFFSREGFEDERVVMRRLVDGHNGRLGR